MFQKLSTRAFQLLPLVENPQPYELVTSAGILYLPCLPRPPPPTPNQQAHPDLLTMGDL